MSTHSVAEVVVDRLVNAGVKRIYGIVGDSLNPISDALRRNGKIAWVHVRHEEVGAFAAGAEAQLSGELTQFPGGLKMVDLADRAVCNINPAISIWASGDRCWIGLIPPSTISLNLWVKQIFF